MGGNLKNAQPLLEAEAELASDSRTRQTTEFSEFEPGRRLGTATYKAGSKKLAQLCG